MDKENQMLDKVTFCSTSIANGIPEIGNWVLWLTMFERVTATGKSRKIKRRKLREEILGLLPIRGAGGTRLASGSGRKVCETDGA